MTPAIETRGLTKVYGGKENVPALVDVNLNVERGEWIAIFGLSGNGRTSLMNILGLLDRPTSGEYLLDGRDTSALSARELAHERGKRIGFIFQGFNLLSKETALGNVALPMIYAGVGRMEAEESGRSKPSAGWGSRTGRITSRPSSPADSNSGSRSPVL